MAKRECDGEEVGLAKRVKDAKEIAVAAINGVLDRFAHNKADGKEGDVICDAIRGGMSDISDFEECLDEWCFHDGCASLDEAEIEALACHMAALLHKLIAPPNDTKLDVDRDKAREMTRIVWGSPGDAKLAALEAALIAANVDLCEWMHRNWQDDDKIDRESQTWVATRMAGLVFEALGR